MNGESDTVKIRGIQAKSPFGNSPEGARVNRTSGRVDLNQRPLNTNFG
jgi:hypothetical protein